jgi:hypothetical protein
VVGGVAELVEGCPECCGFAGLMGWSLDVSFMRWTYIRFQSSINLALGLAWASVGVVGG